MLLALLRGCLRRHPQWYPTPLFLGIVMFLFLSFSVVHRSFFVMIVIILSQWNTIPPPSSCCFFSLVVHHLLTPLVSRANPNSPSKPSTTLLILATLSIPNHSHVLDMILLALRTLLTRPTLLYPVSQVLSGMRGGCAPVSGVCGTCDHVLRHHLWGSHLALPGRRCHGRRGV